MPKTAAQVAQKWATRSSNAQPEYVEGVQTTQKDQAANAIASKGIYQQSLQESFARGAYEKGLQRSGKNKWQARSIALGAQRYSGGVGESVDSYATQSARFDGARGAAAALPRGIKGSETNLARVKAVVMAQRAVKVGK